MTDEFKFSWEESGLAPEPAFTLRSLIIGIIFGCLITIVNTYQQLTTGMVATAAMISSLAMYGVCYVVWGGRRDPGPKEIITAYNIHQAAAFAFSMYPIALIFLIYNKSFQQTGWTMPDWIIPNPITYSDVLTKRIVFHQIWLQPLSWMLPLALFSGVAGLMIVSWFRYQVIEVEKLVFPYGMADAEIIRGVTTNRGTIRAQWLFFGIVVGFVGELLLTQIPTIWPSAPSFLLLPANTLRYRDNTQLLSGFIPGSSWVWIFDITIIGMGMIIPPAASLSMALGAVVFSIFLPYFMIRQGTYRWSSDLATYGQTFNLFRFPYGLSLALGMLPAAALIPIVLQWRAFSRGLKAITSWGNALKRGEMPTIFSLGIFFIFAVLIVAFVGSVLTSPTLVQAGTTVGWGIALFIGVSVVILLIIDSVVGIRIVGETGLPIPIVSGWLYRFVLLASGYRGFEAYYMTSGIIENGGQIASSQAEAFRVGYLLKAKPLHQYIAALFGWTFGLIVSTFVMFGLWAMYGIGSEAMPMPSMEAGVYSIIALATQQYKFQFISLPYIAYGVLISTVLLLVRAFVPAFTIVPITFGMSAYLGAMYSSTFLIGGLIRILLTRLKGQIWFEEKGIPFAAGLLAGGALSIFFAVCIYFIKLAAGGG